VKFLAFDVTGNAGSVVSQVVQIDTVSPNVSFTAPANGSTVTKTVQVKATATDSGGSGLTQVSFYLDGVLQTTVSGSGPSFQWAWNPNKATKTQHTLSATARDNAGNQSTAAITVTVS
jgi:Bacterial Ig domain